MLLPARILEEYINEKSSIIAAFSISVGMTGQMSNQFIDDLNQIVKLFQPTPFS